eukprot:Seg3412.1 transcript_id=Seg3412.1/GoldUCD/mRNA.D3Y31 product="hypothetical protein" protein_id=Seg3412.1/GoldUCD/D3Y31
MQCNRVLSSRVSTAKVSQCTSEDFESTYWKLKEIGPEEIKRRLQRLREIQRTIELAKESMTRETKYFSADQRKRSSGLKEETKEMLTLPRILPEVYQKGKLTGYSDEKIDIKKYDEQAQTETKTKQERKRKYSKSKKSKSKDSLCVSCHMEVFHGKAWLPQLRESSLETRPNTRTEKDEKFVLPQIRFSNFR